MISTLQFMGAVETVTGSRHFLETRGKQLLIDCGLFQGRKENRLKNWDPFPIAPDSIDAVILTHAHIDHIGYLPRLVKDGYRGPIYATHPTVELADTLLRDTAKLQQEEAKWANKRGFSKHHPALPLYTEQDAERVLERLQGVSYGEAFTPVEGVRAKYRDMGHILGSAYLDLKTTDREDAQRKIVFSGDIGRPVDTILRPPSQPYNVDYLVMESTYGDRLHKPTDVRQQLANAINDSVERGGALMIPAFAVGRSQSLLYLLREMETENEIPTLPIFLDSPMALKALEAHQNHLRDLNLTCRAKSLAGTDIFSPRKLKLISHVNQSKALNALEGPAIIIAGSGMATGGRILHHMKQRLPDPSNTVLFVGYQAEGTRGRDLVEGKESIRMFGADIPVRAHIVSVDGFSGHADYNEMLAWLMAFNKPIKKAFLVHGEPDASEALGKRIQSEYGWNPILPKIGQRFEIDF